MSKSLPLASVLVSVVLGGAAGGLVLATGGCSKEPATVQVADSSLGDRVAELERQLKDSQNASTRAGRSADAAQLAGATVGDQISQLNARINKLEEQLAAAKAELAAKGTAPAAAAGGDAAATGSAGALLTPPPEGSSWSDEQIARFRSLSEEVERRKTLEAQARRVKSELERAKVTLTPQQEEAIVKLQATYQEKMRELFSSGGFGTNEQERDERRAKMDALRTQFESDLRTVVPAADADKIVDTMRRGFPGLFPRRENMGGMRGGN